MWVDEESDGDDGVATLLDTVLEFAEFAAVEEQFAVAFCGVVEPGTEAVFGDVHFLDEELVADESAIGVGEVGLAFADRLDFGAGENDASGVVVHEEILVGGTFVLDFYDVFFFHNDRVGGGEIR